MTVPPLTPIPVLQEEPSPDRGSIPTPAMVGGLLSRRQIRSITDGCTNVIIKTGGISIILCILGMCIFLVKEVIPLFQPPHATSTEPIALSPPERPSTSALIGIDEHQELAYVLRGDSLEFVFLGGARSAASQVPSRDLLPDGSVTILARAFGKGHHLAMGTEDGRVIPVAIEFTQDFQGNDRSIASSVAVGTPMVAAPTPQPITKMAYQSTDSGVRVAALLQRAVWHRHRRSRSRDRDAVNAKAARVRVPAGARFLSEGDRCEAVRGSTATGGRGNHAGGVLRDAEAHRAQRPAGV